MYQCTTAGAIAVGIVSDLADTRCCSLLYGPSDKRRTILQSLGSFQPENVLMKRINHPGSNYIDGETQITEPGDQRSNTSDAHTWTPKWDIDGSRENGGDTTEGPRAVFRSGDSEC